MLNIKTYILTVAGAAVLSAVASAITPDAWTKYIRLITGLVILCCITMPVLKLINTDISFKVPDNAYEDLEYNEMSNTSLIEDELTKRIEEDIIARMKNEYNKNITAKVSISINGNNEIEGVESITISGDRIDSSAKNRLCQIYGVKEVYEN